MIDPQELTQLIINGVAEGVQGSLNEIAGRARQLAPVRKLFKGGRKRPITGRIGVHSVRALRPYELAFRQARKVGGLGKYPVVGNDIGQGRANSSVPVTGRLKQLDGKRIIGGDDITFREVKRVNGQLQFANTKVRARVGGKMVLLDLRDQFLRRAAVDVRLERGLTSRGGITEYGGTLRDSIEVIPPVTKGNVIQGYVTASAVEHDFNYAYAQEFGTAHNRAQPFLRPALRETYNRIKDRQAMSIKARLAAKRGVRISARVSTQTTIVLKFAGSWIGSGGGDAITRINNRIDRALAVR